MKHILFLILFTFLSIINYGQSFAPSYQSNSSLDFRTFLGGVKYAKIVLSPEVVKFTVDNPYGANGQVISGLIKYLRDIGFSNVEWGAVGSISMTASLCEWVVVAPSWDVIDGAMCNIKLSFVSCQGDLFSFSSARKILLNGYTDVAATLENTCLKMYGYKKDEYSVGKMLSVKSKMTDWTEEKVKTHLKENGADGIEGIYESAENPAASSKYKLGLVKNDEGYRLIYLSGATNYLDWKSGEVKAELYPTATASLFKADWTMADKSIEKDNYVTFEQGFMTIVAPEGDKTLYIKLFPTSADNVVSNNSNPASGTGFAVASSGVIVTNHHVVSGAKTIKVRGVNGDFTKVYSAKVLIDDKTNDLAIIQIVDSSFTTLGNIPFIINSKSSDVGTSVFVMGYPLLASMGEELKLTNGIISSKSGFQGDITSYQISAPIQPGNSGGPLLDNNGNVIGIVNAKHTGAENVSYAIKATYLLTLFDLMSTAPKLQTISNVAGKPLTEQVKILKKFTYIIEVN